MATVALPQFRRPHHQRIAKLLQAFDADLLLKAECYFGGGTAIALSLGEYRESVDIDFLCSSPEGFRMLRSVVNADLGPLLRTPVKHARDVTSNQYKILTVLEIEDVKVKVEIIREANTTLTGVMDLGLGVPILSRTDLWAQKLMANADRAIDKSTMSRDIIDLAMMLRGWGPLPRDAFDKAHAAYGDSLTRGFNNALGVISEPAHLENSMKGMGMDLTHIEDIVIALDDASATLPLSLVEQTERDRRIAALHNLQGSVGASFIFWRAASAATSSTFEHEKNWAQVERDAVFEGVVTHGCDVQEMVDTIATVSPAAVSATRMKAVAARISRQARQLQALHNEGQHRDAEQAGPS
jgi:hypothetical protein